MGQVSDRRQRQLDRLAAAEELEKARQAAREGAGRGAVRRVRKAEKAYNVVQAEEARREAVRAKSKAQKERARQSKFNG